MNNEETVFDNRMNNNEETVVNFRFTESERARENREAVKRDNNNIVSFLESDGYIQLKADSSISSKDLYSIYRMWCDDHDSCHERNLVGAGFLNYSYTDSFSEASLEHSGADNEHTAEKYDGGIGETCVNLFRREYAQNPQCSTCCHSGNSQRDQFSDEEKCCYGQDTQCGNGWIHKGSPSF